MPSLKLHYVIINGQDGGASVGFYADKKATQLACDIEEEAGAPFCENGPHETMLEFDSKGRLLNPEKTKSDLQRELAELRGEEAEEEDDTPAARHFNRAAGTNDSDNCTGKAWYVVRNCGDGSAAVDFYADEECASLATQIEEEGGEAFGDNPHSQEFKFNGKGLLLNPDSTLAELKQELAEKRGEEAEEDDDATPAASAFNTATTPTAEEDFDISGKTVVFTGRLSTMTRKQAESAATALGAHVTDTVTKNTDYLVAGEDAGSKLDKARKLGVTVMTEEQWKGKTALASTVKKPQSPRP